MAAALDAQRLGLVFQSRPDLIEGIKRAADSPARVALFNDITSHIYDQLQGNDEPAQKRRKVGANGAANSNAADEEVLLEVKEISVSVPQRKKFEICLTANHIYARAPGTKAPIPAITYAWSDIEFVFYLPVPEKTQVQHNYVLIPRGGGMPSKTETPAPEPLVFTVPATAPKEGTIGGSEAGTAAAVSDTYKSLFHWALDRRLRAADNSIDIVAANPNKFHSMIRQAHRPNEKAVHIGGFRGSKDGFLFFLENGILWGFKKPLIFIPLNRIAAVSYTNILQITFNIVVEVFAGEGEEMEEFEFGMLDQQDYGGIDDYIKQNRLQDRSMAEQRKGKLQLAENKAKKGADGEENGEGADGSTELERAHQEVEQNMQDEEDEDEEDYDPGSGGESEGSGESSDDDDDDDDDDDAGEDGEGEDAEGEDDGEGEEEEEPEPEPEPEPKPVKAEKATRVKKEKPANVPLRQGWATIGNSRPADDDMDVDEKFDVV